MSAPHTCRSSAETPVDPPRPADQATERWRQRANHAADRLKERAGDQTRQAGAAVRRDAKSVVWRNRRQLAPLALPAAALALGEAGAALAQAPEVGELVAELGTDVVAAGSGLGAWFWIRNWITEQWLGRAKAGLAGAAAWAGLLPITGADAPAMYVGLTVGTLGLAARWWQHHRPGYPTLPGQPDAEPDDPPEPDAEPDIEPDGDEQDQGEDESVPVPVLIERWNDNVACTGGPLPAATIGDPAPFDNGEAYPVQLVPGKQTLASAQANLGKIAGGLRTSERKILLEAKDSEDPTQLELRVVRRSPITTAVYFDRPVYRDGFVELGPYADGQAPGASYALYGPNSMYGGYVLGGTGSGKSRLTEEVAVTALSPEAPPTVVVYLDGQSGDSSSTLWQHALWRGGPDMAASIGKALLRYMRYRGAYLQWRRRKHGGGGFAPTADMPGVLVIVDECHSIFDQAGQLFTQLARQGRKNGFGILAASQVVTLDAFGTGGDALRSSLVAGNGIALKTDSSVQKTIFPGLNADLTSLPPHGYGYTTPGKEVAHRTAQFRTRFLPDRGDAARLAEAGSPLPEHIYPVEDWFAAVAGNQHLGDDAAQVLGQSFVNRNALAQAEEDELDRLIESGDLAAFCEDAPRRTPTAATTGAAAGRRTGASVTPLFSGGFGDLASPSPAPSATAPGKAEPATRHEQLLALLDEHGQLSTRDLAGHLGLSEVSVRKWLAPLVEGGRVRQTSTRGVYTRAS